MSSVVHTARASWQRGADAARRGWLAVRPRWLTPSVVRGIRYGLVLSWAIVFGVEIYRNGLPFWRSDLLLWLCLGLLAASVGKRNVLTVLVDFLPFALVLIAYDNLRGLADSAGMPTWWHPQVAVDRFLFFGTEPTVWLQEHLKYPKPQWYDAVITLCYTSFFFLPYVTAAVLWLRSRRSFYQWALRFVALSFLGFGFFALIPAAPPWAAARCTASEVTHHPYNPPCMGYSGLQSGSLLGDYHSAISGSTPWVEGGLAGRGFDLLHLRFARQVIDEGHDIVDNVAAVPSLHVGGTVLFCLFMWPRVRRGWRPFLFVYPFLMTFSLAYAGEHYVADALAGALCAAFVHFGARHLERRRAARAARKRQTALDTLDVPSDPPRENTWPTPSVRETTPSST